ncbi:MAG TPA: alkaline phosphatase, partial [Nitrolancea sp.]|nr:alkaline phosphatase [Nitrolancea sp.]
LKNDLATHSNVCTLAVWHEPEFDSGPNGSNTIYQTFWTDLYRGGADVILNGHSHLYERFAPQNNVGILDNAHGIVQFTVGTGGVELDHLHTIRPNSMAADPNDFGVLQLTLHPTSYDWQFVTIPGSSGFTDSGSANCHAAP